jgi:asparagine synthase (glutamine-hydrolysing)
MCSISGLFQTRPAEGVQAVERMNAVLRHRGPDDEGVWSHALPHGVVTLGNTRLAIIDTSSAGHQPMLDVETGNCMTYNGEVYNFRELTQRLERLSAFNDSKFKSRSDTEVALNAYSEWGINAFAKLRGMFALAIWDERKRELVLARDRHGIKPLYYFVTDDCLIFASELRALLATGLVPRKLSQAGVNSYLAKGSVTAPLTIVAGVRQLLPGHYLKARATENGTLECSVTRWETDLRELPKPDNRNQAVVQLRAKLEDSIRAHLVSDVPLGVFLSGGMDSSALVALMSRVSETRAKTFSVVFDETDLTEQQYSRVVARRFETDHCEIRLSEEQLLAIVPEALAALDQPTMDGVNTFVVSKAVHDAGVKVALSGVGGDELFAGYPSFRRALKFGALAKTSKRVLRAAAGVGVHFLNGSVRNQKFLELAAGSGSVEEVYRVTRQLFSAASVMELKGELGLGRVASEAQISTDDDTVNAVSRLELNGYMANTLLRDTDAMSMAHSLEVRVPFVDVEVVEYVLSLPGEWKLGNGHANGGADAPKPLLADAVADLLPRDFLARRKMGFTLPFEKWMQGRLRTEISSVFADEKQLADAGLLANGVSAVWRRFLNAPRAVGWSRPWALFVLANWCRVNRVTV